MCGTKLDGIVVRADTDGHTSVRPARALRANAVVPSTQPWLSPLWEPSKNETSSLVLRFRHDFSHVPDSSGNLEIRDPNQIGMLTWSTRQA